MGKKLTFDDLLARKLQRDKDKLKIMSVYIPSMEGELLFNSLREDKLLSIMDGIDDANVTESFEKSKELIYMSCKDLQNPELHNMLGVTSPLDVVSAIFDIDEINKIGVELLKFNGVYGKDDNSITSSIKN